MPSFRLHTPAARYELSELIDLSDEPSHRDLLAAEVATLAGYWIHDRNTFEFKTSGSTGTPKTIAVHRSQIEASAHATLTFFGLQPGAVVVCPLSLSVVGGQMMVYRSLIGALELHVIPADKTLSQLNMNVRYDFMPISAIQLYSILKDDVEKTHVINGIKNILIGGSSISEQLLKLIQEKLTCNVWHSYGMTETVSHIALRRVHPQEEHMYTLLDSIETKLDERSCLAVKGAVTNDTWIQTNDIVECIHSNQFHFIGRSDFTINSGGIKIQVEPLEKIVETIFSELKLSMPFFIGGIADEVLGEKTILVIESEILSEELKLQLHSTLKERLPKYHSPKEIRTASFIYTSSGKINRKETLKKIGQ